MNRSAIKAAGRCSASPAFDNAARTAGSKRMLNGFAFGPREAGLPTGFFILCNFRCIFEHYLYASNCLIPNIRENINVPAQRGAPRAIKPKTRSKEPAKSAEDPVFALIAAHKALDKECWERLYGELDEAQHEAEKTHGERPSSFACRIAWRNYTADCANAIDNLREEFLHQPNADPVQIEREYQDAKARCASIERAGVEWDRRVGIAPLRAQYEAASRAWDRAGMRLARTMPTTLAGIAALINYLLVAGFSFFAIERVDQEGKVEGMSHYGSDLRNILRERNQVLVEQACGSLR